MAAIDTKIWMALKGGATTRLMPYVINWPLEPFDPPQADGKQAPYVEVRQLPAGIGWRPIGSTGRQQYLGILQVTLMWPAGQVGEEDIHPDNLRQKVGVLADRFKTDSKMKFEDVAVRVDQAPEIAQPLRDGSYWRIPVSINYSCFAN